MKNCTIKSILDGETAKMKWSKYLVYINLKAKCWTMFIRKVCMLHKSQNENFSFFPLELASILLLVSVHEECDFFTSLLTITSLPWFQWKICLFVAIHFRYLRHRKYFSKTVLGIFYTEQWKFQNIPVACVINPPSVGSHFDKKICSVHFRCQKAEKFMWNLNQEDVGHKKSLHILTYTP